MPPRRGIVKSGNAGNSSKSKPPADASSTSQSSQRPSASSSIHTNSEKPLFPLGFKYPLSLLYERCQKNGWEKPIVDTRRHNDGWSFVVTLNRMNKKISEKESVRLEPHPHYMLSSAVEARHWGATYALYRFCNGIQLNRVLPAGPREYWAQLAEEHKHAPHWQHMQWMWDADPFVARRQVDERQAKAAEKRQAVGEGSSSSQGGGDIAALKGVGNIPEVKMASGIRDVVEDAIKKAIALYPNAVGSDSNVMESNLSDIIMQLTSLGFNNSQAEDAVTFAR